MTTAHAIEKQIGVILELLEDDETIERTLTFIIACGEYRRPPRMTSLLPVLMAVLADRDLKAKAFRAVQVVAKNPDDYVPFLSDSSVSEIAIALLNNSVDSQTPPDSILPALDFLISALASDSVTIRRCAASIIAKLWLHRERSVKSQFTPLQYRLVKLSESAQD
jgi:hypothetical protein